MPSPHAMNIIYSIIGLSFWGTTIALAFLGLWLLVCVVLGGGAGYFSYKNVEFIYRMKYRKLPD